VATLRKKFGERLRQIRAERGMTQERFAEVLDISVDFLSLIERGINAPSFETLEKISRRLRVPVADLFTFYGMVPKRLPTQRLASAGHRVHTQN
jgi:transcriptional regulator with XRE-family HTH domain